MVPLTRLEALAPRATVPNPLTVMVRASPPSKRVPRVSVTPLVAGTKVGSPSRKTVPRVTPSGVALLVVTLRVVDVMASAP